MNESKLSVIIISSVFLLLSATLAHSDNMYVSKWPDFQKDLKPHESKSSVKSILPQDVTIIEPSLEFPNNIRSFSGIWHGWMGENYSTDTKLAVEQITRTGESYSAVIVYAVASKRWDVKPRNFRVTGYFIDDELQATLPGGKAMVIYRLRSDETLDAKWILINEDSWSSGVLEKRTQDK